MASLNVSNLSKQGSFIDLSQAQTVIGGVVEGGCVLPSFSNYLTWTIRKIVPLPLD